MKISLLCVILLGMITRGYSVISFNPSNYTLIIDELASIEYTIEQTENENISYEIYSGNENIVTLPNGNIVLNSSVNVTGSFQIYGQFLGRTSILCKNLATGENTSDKLDVRIIREQTVIDTVFVAVVATLVSIIYINFGCALDWSQPLQIIKKPIGPLIGFAGQFILMPLLSYGIGLLIFPNNPEMRLGMFFVGTSPGGGASNIWTAILKGNINLSVTMSAISIFSAFVMMPLWIFTLGKVIFENANMEVPYGQISSYVVGLIVPLGIGYLIQRYFKKVSNFLVKIMKTFATLLIICIIIFATVTNLYLFTIFSWEIVISGMALPWLGYLIGFLLAKVGKQPLPDCIAIALEFGIQNTGIAIFLLRVALPQPEADLTTVVPVANAILTPVPLALALICMKIRERTKTKSTSGQQTDLQLDELSVNRKNNSV